MKNFQGHAVSIDIFGFIFIFFISIVSLLFHLILFYFISTNFLPTNLLLVTWFHWMSKMCMWMCWSCSPFLIHMVI